MIPYIINTMRKNKSMIKKIKQDIKNYHKKNTSEQKVIDANFISAYKGTFVLKLPIGCYGASFGIIVIGNKVKDAKLVKHEYGHRLQLRDLGIIKYIIHIAIPSLTANLLERMNKLPYDYYGSPWEAGADQYGEVDRKNHNKPWPQNVCNSYKNLIKLFFKS